MPRRRPVTVSDLLVFVAVAGPLLRLMASRWQEAGLTARERLALRRAADRADALLKRATPPVRKRGSPPG